MIAASSCPSVTASIPSAAALLALSLVLAAVAAAVLAVPAFAHQGSYYWAKEDAAGFFLSRPMRPYGAYDGITLRFTRVQCKGYQYQWPGETSLPTDHRYDGTIGYKHFYCDANDRSGRLWRWWAHGHKEKLSYSALRCLLRGPRHPCPSAFG